MLQSSSLITTTTNKMKKAELLFIAPPVTGHLVRQTEFAKPLLDRDDRFSAAVLLMLFLANC
ncbi:hypothetical protein Patl1_33183 [Pistacia atlantica]|uniref:Uncharacterized protein n=1 Tax=Pistacia atlantica TaxID=434234 RepID=A0ACC1ANM5_9ROSI|nr:hypothetical protein Patl1_33183 [Pistacia atlantica]